MSEWEDVIERADEALARYRKTGPSGSMAIDLAASLREVRELVEQNSEGNET